MDPIKTLLGGAVLLAFLALSCAAPLGAAADEGNNAPFSGNIKVEKYHSDYEVNADGTYTVTTELVCTVLTGEGVSGANHTVLSYSTSLDDMEILAAYTLKKDGRRIDVPASNIQEREAVANGGPMFSDLKAKGIIFPDVAVGDKVAYSYKRIRKAPLFPGQFFFVEVFSKFWVYDDVKISVSIPANSLDLHVFDKGVKGGRIADSNGKARWVWTYSNHEITVPEPHSVDLVDYGPRIIVSTFKDYGAIAAAYDKRAQPKAKVSEKVRALASELTKGVTDRREKVRLLCAWVAKNIRFAGNYMGIGSVVPHEADEVLANRLGDCKDHVALLQALLKTVNVDSTPALINSRASFKLPEVASPSVLDHVITYIPSLDLYFDPNFPFVTFGQLPLADRGKPVIHTRNFTGVTHTPPGNPKGDSSTSKMVLHIHEDGSADGEVHNEETGLFSAMVKALMVQVQPNLEERLVRGVLERNGYSGTGTLAKDDPRLPSDKYTYSIKFHVTGALNTPGPGAIYLNSVFPGVAPVASNLGGFNQPERTLDYTCSGNVSTEEITLDLPKNVKVTSLPKDTHLSNARVSYDATYRLKGNTVTVTRRFEDRMVGPVCTPQDENEYRTIGRNVLKDLKEQLIFQPADAG